jgi:hypothetical protein
MVVAVDCTRARPHPGHDRPTPSRQWLVAAVPRPASDVPRPASAVRTWPQLAAPRQPRLGYETMELRSPDLAAQKNGAAGIRTHNLVV